ncbi:BIRC5 isoform 9, partial [Pongo abelii]
NWPFLEGCACTPERMAEAGFIHCPTENEPDLAQCFFCFKELEGWEPDDDPIGPGVVAHVCNPSTVGG